MFAWLRKKESQKPVGLNKPGLKGKGMEDRLDVPVAVMVPLVAMMMADNEKHPAEVDLIHTLCQSSPIFLNPTRSHINAWIAEAERFIRDDCAGSDEVACRRAKSELKKPLRETAYAFAILVLFADEKVKQAEKAKADALAQWFEIDHSTVDKITDVISILRHGRDA